MEIKINETKINISIIGLLGIAFIVLKLCNVINWSWIWVLAPFWIPLGIIIIIIVIIAIVNFYNNFI